MNDRLFDLQGFPYQPNLSEGWGQSVMSWVRFMLELGLYTAPIVLPYIYRRIENPQQGR